VTGLVLLGAAVAVALGLAGAASAVDPVCGNGDASVANTCTYSSSGSEDTFTVPAHGVTSIHVALVGGQGAAGGYGATVAGDLAVTGGEVFYVEVGGNGQAPVTTCGPGGVGGFNGGGTGGVGGGGCAKGGSGGGGASDLRTCSRSAGSCSGGGTSLDSRILVAGGGGGTGGYGNDFCGGGGLRGSGRHGRQRGGGWLFESRERRRRPER
jgi:Glycine rich protein